MLQDRQAGPQRPRRCRLARKHVSTQAPEQRTRIAFLAEVQTEKTHQRPPAVSLQRLSKLPELRGRQLEAGQKVLMLYPSANRDEDVFENPNEFRIDRPPQQLGFGVGSHFCLGANLARMELRVVFEEVLRRMPDLEYAGDGLWSYQEDVYNPKEGNVVIGRWLKAGGKLASR